MNERWTDIPVNYFYIFLSSPSFAKDFVVSGTASDKLFGMAEALWEPNLEPEDLFETISQSLMNAMDRDAYSGWGAVVWVIQKDQVIKRVLKSRMD